MNKYIGAIFGITLCWIIWAVHDNRKIEAQPPPIYQQPQPMPPILPKPEPKLDSEQLKTRVMLDEIWKILSTQQQQIDALRHCVEQNNHWQQEMLQKIDKQTSPQLQPVKGPR